MKVLANSVQKSGTHLLLALLERLGIARYRRWRIDPEWTLERSVGRRLMMQPPGVGESVPIGQGVEVSSWWLERVLRRMPDDHAILGHAAHGAALEDHLAAAGVRTICIVRDPRDVVVSYAHFVMKIGKSKITRKPEHRALVALPDHAARLTAMIDGIDGWTPVPERYRRFLAWRDADALLIRFEDLVGAAGGGDDEAQRRTVAAVAEHLGLPHEPAALDVARAGLFGGTATFRKGVLGQWRDEFDAVHVDAAQRAMGDVLTELGYA